MSEPITKHDWSEWLSLPATIEFLQHIEREWGAGGVRFESIINKFADSNESDPVLMNQIRQVAVCRREILRLAQWPKEELARLSQSSTQPSASPRPAMQEALAGQSRRGGL